MSTQNFRIMSPEAFKAYHPRSEAEIVAHAEESKFRNWCEEFEEDPLDECSRDRYNEIMEETGDKFWEGLDKNERAGWEDNMTKD